MSTRASRGVRAPRRARRRGRAPRRTTRRHGRPASRRRRSRSAPRPSGPAAVKGRRKSSRAASAPPPASRRRRKPPPAGPVSGPSATNPASGGSDDGVDGVPPALERPRAGLGGVAVPGGDRSTHAESLVPRLATSRGVGAHRRRDRSRRCAAASASCSDCERISGVGRIPASHSTMALRSRSPVAWPFSCRRRRTASGLAAALKHDAPRADELGAVPMRAHLATRHS